MSVSDACLGDTNKVDRLPVAVDTFLSSKITW